MLCLPLIRAGIFMPSRPPTSPFPRLLATLLVAALLLLAARPTRAILAGEYLNTGQLNYWTDLNELLGATTFYNNGFWGWDATVANIEGGWVWNGHETLSQGQITEHLFDPNSTAKSSLTNWHATMVGQLIAGRGDLKFTYVFPYGWEVSYKYIQIGMAPLATLWTGAIATSIQSDGSFAITESSFLYPYLTALRDGVSSGATADVINGSWGSSDGSDGNTFETRALVALAASSGKTIVFAAGNGSGAPLNSPATMFNRIAVASYGGLTNALPYRAVSDFSSAGPNEFFLPSSADGSSGTVISNARASVDLAAPGEYIIAAAYTGNPAQTNLYYVNESGTSFAAPLVAGGAALLVDAGKNLYGGGNAVDARVIKAVLMNSADRFAGWSNGLHKLGGLLVTTQSLDFAVGAGRLDLSTAYTQYTAGTHDVAGLGAAPSAPWAGTMASSPQVAPTTTSSRCPPRPAENSMLRSTGLPMARSTPMPSLCPTEVFLTSTSRSGSRTGAPPWRRSPLRPAPTTTSSSFRSTRPRMGAM